MPVLLHPNGAITVLAPNGLCKELIEENIGNRIRYHDFGSALKTANGAFVSLAYSLRAEKQGEPANAMIAQLCKDNGVEFVPVYGHAMLISEADLLGYAQRCLGDQAA